MKLVPGKENLELRLSPTETRMFVHVMSAYPRVPPAHFSLSRDLKAVPDAEASQALLEEALAEQRAANRASLLRLLRDPARKKALPRGGLSLTLTYPEVQTLLQALNDVRVGSWVRMGSPENIDRTGTEAESQDYVLMQVAGYFQSCILESLSGGQT